MAHPRVSRGLCSSQSPRDPHWLKHHPWENLAIVGEVEKNPPALKCFFPTVKDFNSAVSLAKQVRKPASLQGHQSVQLLCHVRLFATPWTAAHQASLYITNSRSLLQVISILLVRPSNHLILCLPLLLLFSIFPSIRVFSNESVLRIKWPKYWSFSFSISPSNEYSGLISFRIDWFDPLAVQGTLRSLLQHHSSKASVLWCSAFFMVQLSHPYMTSGKTKALIRPTFSAK